MQFRILFSLLFLLAFFLLPAQEVKDEDAFFIRDIYDKALTQGQAYEWLDYLTQRIGGRLSGSPQAAAAVEYTRQVLDTIQLDSVWLQPCMVPHWERGEPEVVRIVRSQMGTVDLNALALGNSVGTGPEGLRAEVVEVKSLDEVDELGREGVEGRIVFYNRPMDPTLSATSTTITRPSTRRMWSTNGNWNWARLLSPAWCICSINTGWIRGVGGRQGRAGKYTFRVKTGDWKTFGSGKSRQSEVSPDRAV